MTRALAGRALIAVLLVALGATAALLAAGRGGEQDRPAGKVEIGFAQDMIAHHAQAVTLTQAVLGGDPGDSVAQLATGMQLAQLREIGQLEGFLTLWEAPHIGADPPMSWMETHPHSADAPMPGLATPDEIDAFADLKGEALEARFLQLMIRHHQGGVLMADAAARRAAHPAVRTLALHMSAAQRKETATMTALLAALGAEPLPA
ncbi:DUF305 domain-containing protein [Actinocorallia sp. A-T 12471]|uniref:DUF305 domain-containing protein n=1 Tax=Actinocorallia sp. A-T 12471 TaxID=3089813 RepID=UPI0029D11BF3|nr:DUF305 domain-containing protein [Actinocorallia sp. A-T 12471]MDX6744838.1 DUF305 domain-containing protein [Actinocorallia sp. A-T 12471]